MKKTISILGAAVILLLLILLVSCGESAKTTDFSGRELRFPEDFTVEEIKLPETGEQISSAAFSPDGSICVNLSRSIAVYDKQHSLIKTINNPPGEFIHTIAFDAKGNVYAGGNSKSGDNFIRVYNAGGELLKGHKNLLETRDLAIIREIVIDKAGNMYVLIKYGSIAEWSVAVLSPDGQLIKEIKGGKATPRLLFTDENGNIYAGCWYVNKPEPDEPRLYKFTGIDSMKYDSFDEYTDFISVETESQSIIDKNGILFTRYKAYYDGFKKCCDINIFDSGFDFSMHSIMGWTKDNGGNAVFWLGLIQASGGSDDAEYNSNLYRVKLKAAE